MYLFRHQDWLVAVCVLFELFLRFMLHLCASIQNEYFYWLLEIILKYKNLYATSTLNGVTYFIYSGKVLSHEKDTREWMISRAKSRKRIVDDVMTWRLILGVYRHHRKGDDSVLKAGGSLTSFWLRGAHIIYDKWCSSVRQYKYVFRNIIKLMNKSFPRRKLEIKY